MEKLNIELRWKREKRPLGPPRRWVALIAVAVVGTVWAEPGGADAASSHRLVTVPALAVSSTQEGDGGVHYVVIQVDQNSRLNGPIVLCSTNRRFAAARSSARNGKTLHKWR
jgi:hypothetical protein